MSLRPPSANHEKEGWLSRHKQKLREALMRKDEINLVFLGDSIFKAWEDKGKREWKKYFAPYGALNLGFGGDRTEHLIWRLQQGSLAPLKPKLVVLLIGTNNTGHCEDAAELTAQAIKQTVQLIHSQLPDTRILLHGLLPCGRFADHHHRQINKKVNQLIQPLSELGYVNWLELTHLFLQDKGEISEQVMRDFLHPNVYQYKIWAEALAPVVERLITRSCE